MAETRKVMEYLFRDTDIHITLYSLHKPGAKQNQDADRSKTTTENAVIVRANGKIYAELLTEVKQNVGTKALGITVDAVKETRKHTKRRESCPTYQRVGWGDR